MRSNRLFAVVLALLLYFGSVAFTQQIAPKAQPPATPVVSVPGTPPAPNPDVPNQSAVSVTEVKSPAAPAHFQEQAIWALLASLLIQYLKKTTWFRWVTTESPSQLKAQFGFMVALITAAGIHFAVSGNLWSDGGASVTVSGLSFNAFKDAAWQWGAQQGWYNAVVKEPREIAVVAAEHSTAPKEPKV